MKFHVTAAYALLAALYLGAALIVSLLWLYYSLPGGGVELQGIGLRKSLLVLTLAVCVAGAATVHALLSRR
jgi:hypothetical protein